MQPYIMLYSTTLYMGVRNRNVPHYRIIILVVILVAAVLVVVLVEVAAARFKIVLCSISTLHTSIVRPCFM